MEFGRKDGHLGFHGIRRARQLARLDGGCAARCGTRLGVRTRLFRLFRGWGLAIGPCRANYWIGGDVDTFPHPPGTTWGATWTLPRIQA